MRCRAVRVALNSLNPGLANLDAGAVLADDARGIPAAAPRPKETRLRIS
jgi:hypothetical protein